MKNTTKLKYMRVIETSVGVERYTRNIVVNQTKIPQLKTQINCEYKKTAQDIQSKMLNTAFNVIAEINFFTELLSTDRN